MVSIVSKGFSFEASASGFTGALSFSGSSVFSASFNLASFDFASGSLDLELSFFILSRESFLSLDLDREESLLLLELPLELDPLELLLEDPLELLELEPPLSLRLPRGDPVLFPDLAVLSRPRSSSFRSPLLPDLDRDLLRSLPLFSGLRSLPRRLEPRRSGEFSLLELRFFAICISYQFYSEQ